MGNISKIFNSSSKAPLSFQEASEQLHAILPFCCPVMFLQPERG